MKRISKWVGVIIILCCALGLSFPAQAENKTPNYLVLKGGIYSPLTNDLDGFNTGFNGEIAFGHYFDKNWAIEAGAGYFGTSASKGAMFGPNSAQTSVHLNVVPLTVAFKGSIPVNRFEFYGIGGIGAYHLETDVDALATENSRVHVSDSDSEILFGGFLGLGAIFNVTPKLFVGLEGKYLWTTQSSFIDAETSLNGIQATFNIGFRF
ncbi:MAG: outer membrane beta-barrel protein [Thermodesulfobacteriota bacterium]|jgi:opacity protein-like surface antigen